MPINTSKLADTALATAAGVKFAKDKAESAYRSAGEAVDQAEAEVRTAKSQKEQARINYNNSVVELDQAEVNKSSTQIQNDIDLNQSEQEKLLKKIDEFDKKYNPEYGGNGIPNKGELAYNKRRMNNLEALRKSRESLELEKEARIVMKNEVNSRKTQLKNARANESQARLNVLDKQVELDKARKRYNKMGGNV